MLTLAIDTATDFGSVALVGHGGDKSVRTFTDRTHAALTVPSIREILAEVGAQTSDVDRVVVGDGPGSFTGLRIGFATAYGIRKMNPAVELLAIPSLAAVALGASHVCPGQIVALFDAMRGEVFAAIYDFTDGAGIEILEPSISRIEEVARAHPSVCAAAGDGADRSDEAIRRWTGRAPVPPGEREPVASQLLDLAEKGLFARRVGKAADFKINYGRVPAAQSKWETENERELPHQAG